MKVALLTREYPPDVYGGAGVHVAYLARELASRVELTVHCEGGERPGAVAHQPWDQLAGANQALRTMSVDLVMTATVTGISCPYVGMMFPWVTLVYHYFVSMVPVEMVSCG